MPIERPCNLEAVHQQDFAEIAYEVIRHAYAIQNELGPFFDECIYRNALRLRLGGTAQAEVRIGVRFDDFLHEYYMDLLVSNCAVFELKVVSSLGNAHRSQLMNYLLLCELNHGKLINFGPPQLEHEFVNAHLTKQQRTSFDVHFENWQATNLSDWLIDFFHDIGTGLDASLYEKAACHFFGGEENVVHWVDIPSLGRQKAKLSSADWAFDVTTLHNRSLKSYEYGLQRFLRRTKLEGLHWVNIDRNLINFRSLTA